MKEKNKGLSSSQNHPNDILALIGKRGWVFECNNSNPFYQTEKIAEPIISEKAKITLPDLTKTFVYDISTLKGKLISWFRNNIFGNR
ncbi:MAG: hypothetical protein ABIN97_05875 [Ginsengibacter sp.]